MEDKNKSTSSKVASEASDVMRSDNADAEEKSVAASALSQKESDDNK